MALIGNTPITKSAFAPIAPGPWPGDRMCGSRDLILSIALGVAAPRRPATATKYTQGKNGSAFW